MRTITLNRYFIETTSGSPNYQLAVNVTAADDMPKEIFVKQLINKTNNDAIFAAVASPVQLEDLTTNIPYAEGEFFRTSTITLVAANSDTLEEIYSELLKEIQLLINNLNALDLLEGSVSIQLDGTNITTL